MIVKFLIIKIFLQSVPKNDRMITRHSIFAIHFRADPLDGDTLLVVSDNLLIEKKRESEIYKCVSILVG